MPLYQWDSALETGNATIDDQHRQLFALAAYSGPSRSPIPREADQ